MQPAGQYTVNLYANVMWTDIEGAHLQFVHLKALQITIATDGTITDAVGNVIHNPAAENGGADGGGEAGIGGGLGTMTMPLTSSHAGGVHVVLADGGTRFVAETIDENVWAALGTRAGGEPIDAF